MSPSTRTSTQAVPILDRSRSRLRLPIDILPEALRQAGGEGLASPIATVRMETGGVIADGQLDPVAAEMLEVISGASMVVAVDVQCEGDSSVTTIWATPNRAVLTSNLDPDLVDIRPVRLARLPETLSDTILLGPPQWTGGQPIVVPAAVVAEAERYVDEVDKARATYVAAGVEPGDIGRLLAFAQRSTRRWRISSTWATDSGQRMAELRGLDAGTQGQWVMELREQGAGDDEPAELTFTPQGDGELLRALREVLPRYWVGTALNAQR